MTTLCRDTGDLVIEFLNEDGKPLYRLQPYSNHLCYVIYKWTEVKKREDGELSWEWKQLECYPSTLEYGCTKIRDWLVMEGGIADDVTSLTEVRKTITRSTNTIVNAIKNATAK